MELYAYIFSTDHHHPVVRFEGGENLLHHLPRMHGARDPHRDEFTAAPALFDLHLRRNNLAPADVCNLSFEVVDGSFSQIGALPRRLKGVVGRELGERVVYLSLLLLRAHPDWIVFSTHGSDGEVETSRAEVVESLASLGVNQVPIRVQR